MGLVAVVFKIMPESADDLGRIKEKIRSGFHVQDMKEMPVGFGITALEIMVIFDDKKGIGNIEEELSAIDGVASIESGDVTLI